MDEHKKFEALYKIIRFIGKPIVCAKYRYRYESIKDVKAPYLVLANHTTDIDSAFLGIASA